MYCQRFFPLMLVWSVLFPHALFLHADEIVFPSRVTNGSFEEWSGNLPVGWREAGWIIAHQADPLYGEYAVELSNNNPWEGYLYQDLTYHGGSFLFGCGHWSWVDWGDEIVVRYFDAQMQEISHRTWESHAGDWQYILEVLRPPPATAVVRVELIPMLDAIGTLVVDHLFVIPIGRH